MKTVIEMARAAGFLEHEGTLYTNHKFGDCFGELERFAELVRADAIADEREACIRIMFDYCYGDIECEQAATLIRARGNK